MLAACKTSWKHASIVLDHGYNVLKHDRIIIVTANRGKENVILIVVSAGVKTKGLRSLHHSEPVLSFITG